MSSVLMILSKVLKEELINEIVLTNSDWIQIIGIITSLFLGLIAIIISVKTLKQNNKMIEESTRPVISIYTKFISNSTFIIIKNFGNSACLIDSIETDFMVVKKEEQGFVGNPFDKLKGTSLPPQGHLICLLQLHRIEWKRKYLILM